ncbi:hypothetical protein [Roseomonas sp. BN140053]|uniref:hypothetical protein n=1 Tax=Roseomonas sp. BN140053 TaxID=3391898 RepID=UPI0039E9DB1C
MRRRTLAARLAVLPLLTLLAACVQPVAVPVYGQGPTGCDTSFRVSNASGATIREFYFSHASLGGWGSDQLGRDVLSPGESRGYRAANTGLYDFRTVWTDGSAAEIRQVDICRASQITAYRGRLTAS